MGEWVDASFRAPHASRSPTANVCHNPTLTPAGNMSSSPRCCVAVLPCCRARLMRHPALSYHAMPCPAMPCPVQSCSVTQGVLLLPSSTCRRPKACDSAIAIARVSKVNDSAPPFPLSPPLPAEQMNLRSADGMPWHSGHSIPSLDHEMVGRQPRSAGSTADDATAANGPHRLLHALLPKNTRLVLAHWPAMPALTAPFPRPPLPPGLWLVAATPGTRRTVGSSLGPGGWKHNRRRNVLYCTVEACTVA